MYFGENWSSSNINKDCILLGDIGKFGYND